MNEVCPSLVTTYAFKNGKEYIVKIKVSSLKGCQRNLELAVTDKYTAENWQSSYDAACMFFTMNYFMVKYISHYVIIINYVLIVFRY